MSVQSTHYRLIFVSVFIFVIYIYYTIYLPDWKKIQLNLDDIENDVDGEYLVNNNKCRIQNINPFNQEVLKYFVRRDYVHCNDNRPLLTYVVTVNDVPYLRINHSVAPLYSFFSVYCCYQTVVRRYVKDDPDGHIRTSTYCKRFDNETVIETDTVKVKCQNFWHRVYENTHTVVLKTAKIKEKLQNFHAKNRPLSVLFVGIDSISRINLIRMLPKTRRYLVENSWIEMKGYNKMGDNTFPNLMAVFTGKNESYAFKTCLPYSIGGMDKCDLIWYDFRKTGYITGYAEDESSINTFNYLKKGFNNTPTDYYFRPYFIASEELSITWVDGSRYCTGPETAGERVLNIAKEFASTFSNDPFFGVFWTNSFSHNDISTPSIMDGKILEFFHDLEANNVLNTSMVVFVSDHGIRFGEIRNTRTGWFEERLPYLYFWLPKWFREKYPNAYENMRKNQNRFTTPYDLFLTLQDVLTYSGTNHTVRPSSACSTCASLFDEAMESRNCKESGIDAHWCTCADYVFIDTNSILVKQAANFVIDYLNDKLKRNKIDHKCHSFNLDKIMSASVSHSNNKLDTDNFILLLLKSKEGATLEATVQKEKDQTSNDNKFSLQGTVSRLDWYGSTSGCVNEMKMYCICKSKFR